MQLLPWSNWDKAGIENEITTFQKIGYEFKSDFKDAERGIGKLHSMDNAIPMSVEVQKVDLEKRSWFGKKKVGWLAIVSLGSEVLNNFKHGYLVANFQASIWSQVANLIIGQTELIEAHEDAQKALEEL